MLISVNVWMVHLARDWSHERQHGKPTTNAFWFRLLILCLISIGYVCSYYIFYKEADLLPNVDAHAPRHEIRKYVIDRLRNAIDRNSTSADIALLRQMSTDYAITRSYLAHGSHGVRCMSYAIPEHRTMETDDEDMEQITCVLSAYLPWYIFLFHTYYAMMLAGGENPGNAMGAARDVVYMAIHEEIWEKYQIALPESERLHESSERRIVRGSPFLHHDNSRVIVGAILPILVYIRAYLMDRSNEDISRIREDEAWQRRAWVTMG